MIKHLLAKVAEIAMIALAIVAIVPAAQLWWLRFRIPIIIVALLAVVCSVTHGVLLAREDKHREKREIERDERFESLASLIAAVPNSHGTQDSASPPSLREKVLELGHDLFAFLREKGPKPDARAKRIQPWEDAFKEIVAARGPYVEAVHYGYLHRFRQRAIDLFNELAEHGITVPEIHSWEIDPPQAVRAANVRRIAEALFLLAARMDIKDASRGI